MGISQKENIKRGSHGRRKTKLYHVWCSMKSAEYESIKQAEKETGINNSKITMCCKGRRKHAGGFCWKYKKENKDMNKCYFTGRTTKDIEIRYMQNDNQTAIGRFSLAVESGYKEKKRTDFFNMTAWGKTAETMEKYVSKGTKIIVECEARQNNYTDKNGNKVNTVDFTVLNFEFAESKNASQSERPQPTPQTDNDGFMNIPDGIDSELPFS